MPQQTDANVAMEYIDVAWHHDNDADPIRLVSELDVMGFETRKLEFFLHGSIGFASQSLSSNGTALGTEPVPSLTVINMDQQFFGEKISAAQFERLWAKYAGKL